MNKAVDSIDRITILHMLKMHGIPEKISTSIAIFVPANDDGNLHPTDRFEVTSGGQQDNMPSP